MKKKWWVAVADNQEAVDHGAYEVRKLLPTLHCLTVTKDGHPGHPL